MKCPACKSPLVVVEREGIELDWCVACLGLWFDDGELELLGEKTGRVIDVSDLDAHAARISRGDRRCPRCPKRMAQLELPVGATEVIVIDRCAEHGFWLDRGELGTLLTRLGRRRETDGDLVLEFLGETFHESATVPETARSAPDEGRTQ